MGNCVLMMSVEVPLVSGNQNLFRVSLSKKQACIRKTQERLVGPESIMRILFHQD